MFGPDVGQGGSKRANVQRAVSNWEAFHGPRFSSGSRTLFMLAIALFEVKRSGHIPTKSRLTQGFPFMQQTTKSSWETICRVPEAIVHREYKQDVSLKLR